MKLWKVVALLAAGFAVMGTAIACSDDNNDDANGSPTAGATESSSDGAQTLSIQVDGDGDGFDAFMIAYFPAKVTAHAGDTLKFKLENSGEPHTVTSGAPVKALMDFVYATCGPEGFSAAKCQDESQIPPDVGAQFDTLLGAIPTLLPEGGDDADQTAANPCFLATGDIPANTPCPKVNQPAYMGTESLYNSGWMSSDDDFVVKLDPNLAPGPYTFLCLLHGPEMTETVTVVAASADADSSDEVDARRDEELAAFQDALAKPAEDLQAFAGSTDPVPTNVQVSGDSEQLPAGVAEFGPTDFTVPVGGSVTWSDLGGGHTVSFNAPESAKSLRVVSADGTIHVNPEAAAPADVTPAEPAGDPEDPATPPTVTEGGSWDGEGFLSTGFLNGFFKLTFAKAGTYEYKCLIHEGMEGTIKVE